ncbi:unnamed protein product [Phytophthora fragariaefolia]|uniref:Unnamed protein product n=1 Tax=Phytophthora fragariaefolia TaxID=1490495 RepID=A0A9W6X792_9STRA|nr:unnamed protein product [Phytophthora fragariaefolia]
MTPPVWHYLWIPTKQIRGRLKLRAPTKTTSSQEHRPRSELHEDAAMPPVKKLFMAVVASHPTPPGRSNPSAASIKRCHSRTVRLECPDELTAAGLGGHADDPSTRPAHRRLAVPVTRLRRHGPFHPSLAAHRDLKAELLERPLLSVFRFVRFSTYFVASPRCDTKFVRVTSDVHLCGQVIAYAATSRMSPVDDGGLLMEPSSGFAVPRLASDLVVPGTPPVPPMDSGPRSVAYITPRGEKTASTVEEYAQDTKLPPRRTAPDDDTDAVDPPPPIQPLLCRADTMLTPSDVFAGPTRSAPQVLVPPATGASHMMSPAPGPGPTPVSTTSTSVRADDPVIQRLFEQQAQLLQQVTLLSASVFHRSSQVNLDHLRLHAEASRWPLPIPDPTVQTVPVPICAADPVGHGVDLGRCARRTARSLIGTGHVLGLADGGTGLVPGARVTATGHVAHHVGLAPAARIVAPRHTTDPHESRA